MFHHPQFSRPETYDIRIWQCTDFHRHWHSSTEIYICLQGHLKICIEGTTYPLHQDDTVFVAGNEAHEIFCNCPNTMVVLISFGYDFLGSEYQKIENCCIDTPFFNLHSSNIPSSFLQPLMQIRDTLCKVENRFPADWIFRSSLYAIAAHILCHKQTNTISPQRLLRAKQLEKMHETLKYISEHYQEPITLEQAATVAGYDKSYFCKQFRHATGTTFHRYLNYCRVSAACRLLEDVKLPMSCVAEQTGFVSQKKLCRLFREIVGMTPTQYRKLPSEDKSSIKPL